MAEPSEFTTLLRAAQRGDEAAFTTLFRTMQPPLLRYLSVVGGAAAEDLAAEVWASVVRDLGSFSADDWPALRAWILQIARRRWIDELRRRSRQPLSLLAELPERPALDDVPAAAEAAADAERTVALLRQLPPDQAEAIALRVIVGLDVPATAALLGKSPGAVRVAAHRGLRRLAELVEGSRASGPDVTAAPRRAM